MARQSHVIEPRAFMSWQWYRQIGMHKYRFRVKKQNGVGVEITAEMAIAKREWKLVHRIYLEESK